MPPASPIPAPDPDAPRGSALHEAKIAARRSLMAARDAMPADARAAASAAITARIAALPTFTAARTVLLTLSFRSEWDTLPLIELALADGKTVAAPRVNRATRMLDLHALVDPPHDLVAGTFGIPEPDPRADPVAPETRRLGAGAGHRLRPVGPAPGIRRRLLRSPAAAALPARPAWPARSTCNWWIGCRPRRTTLAWTSSSPSRRHSSSPPSRRAGLSEAARPGRPRTRLRGFPDPLQLS